MLRKNKLPLAVIVICGAILFWFISGQVNKSRLEAAKIEGNKGVRMYQRGDWKASINFLENATKKYPDNYQWSSFLAAAYQRNGQTGKSIEQYEKLLEKHPKMPDPYFYLAAAKKHAGKKDYKKQKSLLAEAVKLKPDFVGAWMLIGDLEMENDNPLDAIEAWNAVVPLVSKSSGYESLAQNKIAQAHLKLQNRQQAIDAWKKALAADPNNSEARENLRSFGVQ